VYIIVIISLRYSDDGKRYRQWISTGGSCYHTWDCSVATTRTTLQHVCRKPSCLCCRLHCSWRKLNCWIHTKHLNCGELLLYEFNLVHRPIAYNRWMLAWSNANSMKRLQVIEEDGCQELSKVAGCYLLERLSSLRDEFECVGDVRGKGLMVGFEFVQDKACILQHCSVNSSLCNAVFVLNIYHVLIATVTDVSLVKMVTHTWMLGVRLRSYTCIRLPVLYNTSELIALK